MQQHQNLSTNDIYAAQRETHLTRGSFCGQWPASYRGWRLPPESGPMLNSGGWLWFVSELQSSAKNLKPIVAHGETEGKKKKVIPVVNHVSLGQSVPMSCVFLFCKLSRSVVTEHGNDFLLSRGLLSLALPWDTCEVVSTWVKRWICFSHPGWVEWDVPQGAWDLVLSPENIPSIYEGISRAKLIFLLRFTKAQAEPSPRKTKRRPHRKHYANTDVYVFTFASF